MTDQLLIPQKKKKGVKESSNCTSVVIKLLSFFAKMDGHNNCDKKKEIENALK